MHRKIGFYLLFQLLFLGWLGGAVHAQSSTVLPEKIAWDTKKKDGWFPSLSTGFNFSFSQSDGVVGVPDGTTLAFGLQLEGGLVFASGPHEWRSTLKIIHTQTKLPTIKPFLKSADRAELESAYTYRITKWFGVFGSLKLDTSLMTGSLVKDKETTLLITEADESKTQKTITAQIPFQLTAGFAPLLFKQSLGADFLPYDKPSIRVNLKAGVGAVEAWVQGGYRLDDNKDTAEIEIKGLQNYAQIGGELKLNVNGKLFENIFTYTLIADVMFPFYTSVKTDLSFSELINFEFGVKLGIQLSKWLAIQYKLAVIRTPMIQPKVQITNNLMLSLTADII